VGAISSLFECFAVERKEGNGTYCTYGVIWEGKMVLANENRDGMG
jgi:hypothetical protein